MPPKMRNCITSKKRRMNNPEKPPHLPDSTAPPPAASIVSPPAASIASPLPETITSPPPVAMGEATPPHLPSEISPPRPTSNEEQLNPPWLPQDNDEDTQPIHPEFYLEQSNYTKCCKLSSRSEENKTIVELEKILGEDQKQEKRLMKLQQKLEKMVVRWLVKLQQMQ
ncbi:PREDICTED: branchpoint-bridging protein-like [Camelina sativa]|uniref:Branchpoint-bridging protein-like n=1 Tax=Camelina sativa TaxID=90675 RepID=A0ABM1QXM1_CAMSA|nr:PREDICTED: branchpoint-bridging protein-like [Camelina sativa]